MFKFTYTRGLYELVLNQKSWETCNHLGKSYIHTTKRHHHHTRRIFLGKALQSSPCVDILSGNQPLLLLRLLGIGNGSLVRRHKIDIEVLMECIAAEPNTVPHQVLEPGKWLLSDVKQEASWLHIRKGRKKGKKEGREEELERKGVRKRKRKKGKAYRGRVRRKEGK